MTDVEIDLEDDGRDEDGSCLECGAAADEECDLDCSNYPPEGYPDEDDDDDDDNDGDDDEDDLEELDDDDDEDEED